MDAHDSADDKIGCGVSCNRRQSIKTGGDLRPLPGGELLQALVESLFHRRVRDRDDLRLKSLNLCGQERGVAACRQSGHAEMGRKLLDDLAAPSSDWSRR